MFSTTSTGLSLPSRIKFPVVSEIQSQLLVMPIGDEKVKNVVFAMHSDKSHGVDGLNPGIYQDY